MANIIRLDLNSGHLPVFNDDSVALAAVISQEPSGGELEVPGAGEGAAAVGQEADPGFLLRVEGFVPCVHAAGGLVRARG